MVTSTITPNRYEVELKTADNRPGHLTIVRAPPPKVYEATATIGRTNPDREMATRLLEALEQRMIEASHKRRFTDAPR